MNNQNKEIKKWEEIEKVKHKGLPKNKALNNKFKHIIQIPDSKPLKILKAINERIIYEIKNESDITPVNNLINIVAHTDILTIAYAQIKGNKGATTPGSEGIEADSTNMNLINKLSEQIKNNTFQWSPTKLVLIPKPGKPEKRPLGLPDFTNKLVQTSIAIILETIYEPQFAKVNANFGFRPKMDCNKAIEEKKRKTPGMLYCLEADIKGAYDNVDHQILMKILSKHITCKRFLNLIYKGCKAGIITQNKYEDTTLGVTQGSICSPILFNIYMHEFDIFVKEKLTELLIKHNNKKK